MGHNPNLRAVEMVGGVYDKHTVSVLTGEPEQPDGLRVYPLTIYCSYEALVAITHMNGQPISNERHHVSVCYRLFRQEGGPPDDPVRRYVYSGIALLPPTVSPGVSVWFVPTGNIRPLF